MPPLHERHDLAQLVERLPEAGHVAMPENAESGRDKAAPVPVGFGVLPRQIGNDGLRDGESHDASMRCSAAHREISFERWVGCYGRPLPGTAMKDDRLHFGHLLDRRPWSFLADVAALRAAVGH